MECPEPANPEDEDCFFLTEEGFSLTTAAVQKVFQRVKKAAGLKRFHPHLCRHTFAVRYLVNGGDVFSLQRILGHTTREMIRQYVNLATGTIRASHRKFSPVDNLNLAKRPRGRKRIN